jgi:hypothetical protein
MNSRTSKPSLFLINYPQIFSNSNETVEKPKFALTLVNSVHQNTSARPRLTFLGHPRKPFFITTLTEVRLLTFSTVSTTRHNRRPAAYNNSAIHASRLGVRLMPLLDQLSCI